MEFSGKYSVDAMQYREAREIRELLLRDAIHAFGEYFSFANYGLISVQICVP
jgi:hypothetical protein